MIAHLSGLIVHKDTDHLIIDVQGVGYRAFCSRKTLDNINKSTDKITLHTETITREDGITLYGFATIAERQWFRRLLSVQGVGSKAALAILSVLTPDEIYHAILLEKKAFLTQADGVGPKLAARIINELKDNPSVKLHKTTPSAPAAHISASPTQDALTALTQLGFSPSDALHALQKAETDLGSEAALGQLIKAALQRLQPAEV